MLDDVATFHNSLGWMEYVEMNRISYNGFMLEFLNSLLVDWARVYRAQEVLISFYMFNTDH